MYKRDMCKNWTEAGFCRYGSKCQYAHGQEELSENHQLYLNEQKQANVNDKYKSQNCRQFYREKFCPYGKRCHFRHEYRSFKKIHRHFYMAHLAAMSHHVYQDVLADSKTAPDGSTIADSSNGEKLSIDQAAGSGSEDSSNFFDAFIISHNKQANSTSSVDVSTDSGSALAEGGDHLSSQHMILMPLI